MHRWVAARISVLATAYGLTVTLLGGTAKGLWSEARGSAWASFDADLTLIAALGAWVSLLWLGIGFALALLAALPNAAGHWCRQVAATVTPPAVRRLAQLALGMSVLAGGGIAVEGAAALPAVVASPTATAVGRPELPPPETRQLPTDLDWPRAQIVPPRTVIPPPRTVMTPVTRTTGPAAAGTADRRIVAGRPTRAQRSGDVVVRCGDTLWGIAARHLGSGASVREIAAAWPGWYAANRQVIGPDPDVIRPGQRLHEPLNPHHSTGDSR
jgi:hypothetical protein